MRQLWVGDGFTLAVRLLFPPTRRATLWRRTVGRRDSWARKRSVIQENRNEAVDVPFKLIISRILYGLVVVY